MNTDNNALDFRDPGPMSHELLSVPGFVNELKNLTLAVAPRLNEPLAFAGALAALAPTGTGKDEPRVVNKELAAASGSSDASSETCKSAQCSP